MSKYKPIIETCDVGHKFAKLPDHPKKDGISRCPHCLSIGLDKCREYSETNFSLLKESNQLLRSMYAIAERRGLGTNWEPFTEELNVVLEKQHKLLYGDNI